MGRFEYQCGQDRMGKAPLDEVRNRDLWQDSGFDGKVEGCGGGEGGRDLSFAPCSTCSPVMHPAVGREKKKYTLTSE